MQQLVFTIKNNDLQKEASLGNIIFVKMSGDQVWKPEKGHEKSLTTFSEELEGVPKISRLCI